MDCFHLVVRAALLAPALFGGVDDNATILALIGKRVVLSDTTTLATTFSSVPITPPATTTIGPLVATASATIFPPPTVATTAVAGDTPPWLALVFLCRWVGFGNVPNLLASLATTILT